MDEGTARAIHLYLPGRIHGGVFIIYTAGQKLQSSIKSSLLKQIEAQITLKKRAKAVSETDALRSINERFDENVEILTCGN